MFSDRAKTEGVTLGTVPWRSYQTVLFDCDSTLTEVEGIDELAVDPHHQDAISELTNQAMTGDCRLEDVYGQRLEMLNPTRSEIRSVKNRYKAGAVPHAKSTVAALHDAEVEAWIISGGLADPVLEFATWLGIESDRVRAVETEFDPFDGNWWEPAKAEARYASYTSDELTCTDGKAEVIRVNVTTKGRRLLVGDGISDLAAADAVDLFVAYAGVVERTTVVDKAPVVITSRTISPVLALALGPERVKEMIGGSHDNVARACWDAIDGGALRFNDEALAARFAGAF
jgi:phosphoserine phosphatase